MGNWWLAASSWQCACSRITYCAEFFGKTSNHPGDSASWEPRFGAVWLLAKTKITFEREEISDCWWDSGKYDRAADGDWENCVRSQGSYFEGDWGIIFLCTMFLVSFSINVSIFHSSWLATFWSNLVYLLSRESWFHYWTGNGDEVFSFLRGGAAALCTTWWSFTAKQSRELIPLKMGFLQCYRKSVCNVVFILIWGNKCLMCSPSNP